MGNIAVIDTETNWANQVMSVGTVIADDETFRPLAARYHLFPQECQIGGMYEKALFLPTPVAPIALPREEAMADIAQWLREQGVQSIFAYNARFDRNHLTELHGFSWHDIMALAAYRQHNPKLPREWDFCSTGRLRRGYGVEPMLRLLSGNPEYIETHNALLDALDELDILRLLGHSINSYAAL